MTPHFCSRLAEAAHGAIAGTGVRGEAYAFLPVDKKRWGHREFNESWASPEELDAIRRARRAGVIVRLYDPPAETARPAILVHRSPACSAEGDAAIQALAAALARHPWDLDDGGDPRLALCTQGTRDRCCAKWGFAVFRAARAAYDAGAIPFAPIECSHLGGDRFAATGIAFPSGSMYGHLDRLDLAELAAAEAEGRILQSHYRGRVFDSLLTQVVRAGLAKDGFGVGTVSDLAIANPDAAPGPLTVTASGRAFEVRLTRREFRFYGDCRAAETDRLSREVRLAYESARPLDVAEPA